jgi:hypothetical protein
LPRPSWPKDPPVFLCWSHPRCCRRKGGQGQEEDKLPCHHVGGPWDTSAAGSVTSQLQASVTEETSASCECLLSGRRETSRPRLCGGPGPWRLHRTPLDYFRPTNMHGECRGPGGMGLNAVTRLGLSRALGLPCILKTRGRGWLIHLEPRITSMATCACVCVCVCVYTFSGTAIYLLGH